MRQVSSQSAEHDPNHGDIDSRLGVCGLGFVVPHQAALLHEPAEGALHDPPLGQDHEAKPAHAEAWIYVTMIGIMLRRLA